MVIDRLAGNLIVDGYVDGWSIARNARLPKQVVGVLQCVRACVAQLDRAPAFEAGG